ncbi:hypothetical protein [Micromonospora zamorensis]|uniref:hypothetical protein n=1 Tax=Micromonospora zamorensis TaxID=709883 RepID=UPI0033D71B69
MAVDKHRYKAVGVGLTGETLRPAPGRSPDEWFLRFLCLQAAEVRDGVEDRQVGAIEQQLPGERRAVERPRVENGHLLIVRPGATVTDDAAGRRGGSPGTRRT